MLSVGHIAGFIDQQYLLNSYMTEVSYHIETSPLTCPENQWIYFYILGTSLMKELFNGWIIVIFLLLAVNYCSKALNLKSL